LKGGIDDSRSFIDSDTAYGGALFAYEIPQSSRLPESSQRVSMTSHGDSLTTTLPSLLASKPDIGSITQAATQSAVPKGAVNEWKRHTLFRGFKVRGWGGIFAPGAPGFPYVFRMPNQPQVAILSLLYLY
jgi:hypothetical protein